MPRLAAPTDLLVANFGLHHWKDYGQRLGEFAAYAQQHRAALPRLFWQQTSQQHFVNGAGSGEYPGGEPPFECGAIANFSVVVRLVPCASLRAQVVLPHPPILHLNHTLCRATAWWSRRRGGVTHSTC